MYKILFILVFIQALNAQTNDADSLSIFDELNLLFIPQYQFYVDDFNVAGIQGKTIDGNRINTNVFFKNGREMHIALGLGFRNIRLLYTFFTSSDIAWNDRAYGKFSSYEMETRLGTGQRSTFGQQVDFRIGLTQKNYIGFIYKNILSDGFDVNKALGPATSRPVMYMNSTKDFLYFYTGFVQRIKHFKFRESAAFSFYGKIFSSNSLIHFDPTNESWPITARPHSFNFNAGFEFKLFHSLPVGFTYNFYYEFARGFYSYFRNGITVQFGFPEL